MLDGVEAQVPDMPARGSVAVTFPAEARPDAAQKAALADLLRRRGLHVEAETRMRQATRLGERPVLVLRLTFRK